MEVKLYNTMERRVVPFEPLVPVRTCPVWP